MKDKKVYQMCVVSVVVALTIVLDMVKIDFGFGRITFYALPLLICGIFYGPLTGALAGLVAGFVIQMLTPYGVGPTTPLWMIPTILWGLMSGILYKANKQRFSWLSIGSIVIFTSLSVSVINTLVGWLDGIILGYDSAVILTQVLIRFAISLGMSIFYTGATYYVVKSLKKAL